MYIGRTNSMKETQIILASVLILIVVLAAGIFIGYFKGSTNGYKQALREAKHYKLGEYVLVEENTYQKRYTWKWNGETLED